MDIEEADKENNRIHRTRVDYIPQEWGEAFGEEFYAFCVQNGLYYIRVNGDWNARAKSRVVSDANELSIISEEELRMSIERMRMKVGAGNNE